MSLQTYYTEFACVSERWSHRDPDVCGCRGGGWWASELDTWHKCPHHGDGAVHPEDEREEEPKRYTLVKGDTQVVFIVLGNRVDVTGAMIGAFFRPEARRIWIALRERGFRRVA